MKSNRISDYSGIVFGDISEIEMVDCSIYRSSSGGINYGELIYKICAICGATDDEIDSSDHLLNEIHDKLLDDLCHQYTLYSLTPIGLYYICKKRRELGFWNNYIDNFIQSIGKLGTNRIILTENEAAQNIVGKLPIFKIEDIISAHKMAQQGDAPETGSSE